MLETNTSISVIGVGQSIKKATVGSEVGNGVLSRSSSVGERRHVKLMRIVVVVM